jgi:hypothetical protein
MPRTVDQMLSEVQERLAATDRDGEALARASSVVERLPLVHRTGRRNRPWRSIFTNARIEAGEAGTRWERDALGVERVAYLFWGYGAYPHGSVALLLAESPAQPRSTAVPFDTGGCEAGHFEGPAGALDEQARAETLERYVLVQGERVAEYGARYVADCFDDPADYVRRPQHSLPDRSPVHGLRSMSKDRRAWTIEVQVHGDISVAPEQLAGVVLRRRGQWRELPTRYRRLARVSSRPDDFGQGIAEVILAGMGDP